MLCELGLELRSQLGRRDLLCDRASRHEQVAHERLRVLEGLLQPLDVRHDLDGRQCVLPQQVVPLEQRGFELRPQLGQRNPLAHRTHGREQLPTECLRIVECRLQLLHSVHQLQRRHHVRPLQLMLCELWLELRSQLGRRDLLCDRPRCRQQLSHERLRVLKSRLQPLDVGHDLHGRQCVLPQQVTLDQPVL